MFLDQQRHGTEKTTGANNIPKHFLLFFSSNIFGEFGRGFRLFVAFYELKNKNAKRFEVVIRQVLISSAGSPIARVVVYCNLGKGTLNVSLNLYQVLLIDALFREGLFG